ncbi:unnamed protein product [Phytophthora lilii]|uniref:Unnamed protein product n=1 Tax=Phytophthora lilii TaxID=2077276 RepID=A0A9W6TYQ9_9STRA|nr:unnamed protein product [Phytophthora lilii]
MMEKDAEFLGAIEFSNEQHMQTASLRTVRDMIYAQVQRVPEDFNFLCQGREVEKVWEVDRRAWSIVPFALRGSPGLRSNILAKNRRLKRPAVNSPFEFRYMGNLITRYKKYIHDIKPVYKHRAFHLRKNAPKKRLDPSVEWRVATTWSGEWIYEQQLIKTHSKSEILKCLRTATRPQQGVLMVKSHFGEILSPCSIIDAADANKSIDRSSSAIIEDIPLLPSPNEEKRMQRIVAMNLRERKREDKSRKQRLQWKARLIAMEAQHQMEERLPTENAKEGQQAVSKDKNQAICSSTNSSMKTVLVRIEEDNVLPSRLIYCEPKKRRRPQKVEWPRARSYQWDIPQRLLSAFPPENKKLKVSKLSDDVSLATPSGTSRNHLGLGRFLSSSNIFLEDNQVEVFPVLIIRPMEEQICVNEYLDNEDDDIVMPSIPPGDETGAFTALKRPWFASKTYLTEFEYNLCANESNFEILYQHIASGTLQDAMWLNRRDVFGRTMLHDAAEFGHANVMELLLKARVIVDIQDSRGDTPLHHAARHGRLKEASMLLREHATPWKLNFEGKSPLYCALETAAEKSPRSVPSAEVNSVDLLADTKLVNERKNFFQAHRVYPQLRQVIDLLWDNYKLKHLVQNDGYDRTNCLDLEKQVYGDMIEACHDGNLLRVQRLVDLDKRPVLKYINDRMEFLQRTALHEATEQGHTATVDLLLKLGADGYLRDQRLQAPLHLAAYKGYDNIVRCLVSKFPQTVSYQDITGCTPLHLAIQQERWNIAIDLINVVKSSPGTSCHDTSAKLSSEVKMLKCVDLQDTQGYTALHYACIHGNLDVCTALINAKAAPSISQCKYNIPKGIPHLLGQWWKGDQRLVGNRKQLIEMSGQSKVVDIEAPVELLLRGCKQNFSNYQERLSVLELLLNHKFTVDSDQGCATLVKISQCPLLHIAAELADTNISVAVEICRRLHKLQVEINMTHPQTGETVLLQECKRICSLLNSFPEANDPGAAEMTNQMALVRSLLELGANADLANETNGESPLGCAAWYGHLPLLNLLLEAGADKDGFLRRCSFSSLHFAALGNNLACAKMLISRSANVNVKMLPTDAETPLYFAIRSKSKEMVDLLLRNDADPCCLCTVQQGCTTSFRVVLSVPALKDFQVNQFEIGNDAELQSVGAAPLVVSPLRFGLLIAQSLKMFSVPDELNCTVERLHRHDQWGDMEIICSMLAKQLLENNGGSKGIITHDDIYLASKLGFWGLMQMLLCQQVKLSSAPSSYGMNALHLASASGQTKIVTALVAGGMNVNCVTRAVSRKPKTASARKTLYDWIGCGHNGALFFALIHGHTETAAKLLVLGANPEQTIPHLRKIIRWRTGSLRDGYKNVHEHVALRFVVSESMKKAVRTRYFEKNVHSTPQHDGQPQLVDEASVNLSHLIECSINQKVPLLHLVVALGYVRLVQCCVEAGMSIFSEFVAPPEPHVGMAGWNAPPETPIHIAIACGHLEIVKYFATIVQNQFPGCFIREGKTLKSLLVTASEEHQLKVLRFLLKSGKDGGGFAYETCADEFQSALSTCAEAQFVEGFELLTQNGPKPNIHTLVSALKGIILSTTKSPASSIASTVEPLGGDERTYRVAFSGERYQHDIKKNSVKKATKLLQMILSLGCDGEISEFIGTSPIFDLVLNTLVICSRHQLWFVLETVFVQHQEYFVDVASIWKPVLVRAAGCCMVLHRAAMHNQVELVLFLLRLGVPPNLQLSQVPPTKCPIWYAASRCCLNTFLCLALHSKSFIEDLLFGQELNNLPLVFRSIEESRSSLSTSDTACKWQNLGVFGCVDLPKKKTSGYLIQKLTNYGLMISRGHTDNSLLHHACRRGELLAVQVLVQAGADMTALNRKGESPLDVASSRKDAFGLLVVRFLLSEMAHKKLSTLPIFVNRALIRCFAQDAPCNLNIARALLDSGADVRYVIAATEEEKNICGAQISAVFYAMKTAQLAGVKLLLEHGAEITTSLIEAFLETFLIDSKSTPRQYWRRFSRFMKPTGGKELLLDVEGIMKVVLKKKVFPGAMNSDLVHQMLLSASALAGTIAKEVGVDKQFWGVVNLILDRYPKEITSRKAEWNQKAALHYSVASLELPTTIKLLELRGFDLLAEDENKQTPLHLAAAGGDEVVCRLLLQKLQSNTAKATAIDVPDIHGRTALHLAVINGHVLAANMLLAAGASLDIRCHNGLTALLYAAKCNRLAILIALHPRSAHNTLITSNGDAGVFVALRNGAFSVVRWLMNLYEQESNNKRALFALRCASGRTILHYAAIYGDADTLQILLQTAADVALHSPSEDDSAKPNIKAIIDARDQLGYTPLAYAFAFGRLQAVRMLCKVGADPYASIDHSGEPGAHPYTTSFDIARLLQWFALPGWFSFVSKCLPAQEKIRLVRSDSIEEDYFWNSSYNYRNSRWKPPLEWRRKWKRIPAARLLKSEPLRRGKDLVRTSIRSWKFPGKSIFDYACETGNAQIAEFLISLQLPQLFSSLSYQVQRRNFMQAVRWNRIEIVKVLITSTAPGNTSIESTTGNHFLDFLENGIECAVSRGLEEIAIYLVSQWQGIKENGEQATPSAFAFQFAQAFQIACIRRLPKLVERMIERGGEQLVEFQLQEGPALVYAFAFGHKDIVTLLLSNGADPSIPTASYSAPSVRKWVELGSLKYVGVAWQPQITTTDTRFHRPAFVGPLDTYETSAERLPIEDLCRMFAVTSISSLDHDISFCETNERNSINEEQADCAIRNIPVSMPPSNDNTVRVCDAEPKGKIILEEPAENLSGGNNDGEISVQVTKCFEAKNDTVAVVDANHTKIGEENDQSEPIEARHDCESELNNEAQSADRQAQL